LILFEKRRLFFVVCLVVLVLVVISLQVKQDLAAQNDDNHYQRAFLNVKVNNSFKLADLPDKVVGFIVALDVMPVNEGTLLLPLTALRIDPVVIAKVKLMVNFTGYCLLLVIISFFFIYYQLSRTDQGESWSAPALIFRM
jgi:hypothetical protein